MLWTSEGAVGGDATGQHILACFSLLDWAFSFSAGLCLGINPSLVYTSVGFGVDTVGFSGNDVSFCCSFACDCSLPATFVEVMVTSLLDDLWL